MQVYLTDPMGNHENDAAGFCYSLDAFCVATQTMSKVLTAVSDKTYF